MWNASDDDYRAFENGDFVLVDGATQLFQGNMQMIATRIRRARPDEVCEAGLHHAAERPTSSGCATRLVELLADDQVAAAACDWSRRSPTTKRSWTSSAGAGRR